MGPTWPEEEELQLRRLLLNGLTTENGNVKILPEMQNDEMSIF